MAEDSRKKPNGEKDEDFKALPRSMDQEIHRKPRAFIHRPDEDPALAEEARKNASYVAAAKTIQLEDFNKVGKIPCVRNALLPAIGSGSAIGAARFIIGGSILSACNWASGSFVGVSLVMYQLCQRRRQLEKDGIIKAVKVLDQKQAFKDAQDKILAAEKAESASGGVVKTEIPAKPSTVTAAHSTALSVAGMPASGQVQQEKGGTNFWSTFKFW